MDLAAHIPGPSLKSLGNAVHLLRLQVCTTCPQSPSPQLGGMARRSFFPQSLGSPTPTIDPAQTLQSPTHGPQTWLLNVCPCTLPYCLCKPVVPIEPGCSGYWRSSSLLTQQCQAIRDKQHLSSVLPSN